MVDKDHIIACLINPGSDAPIDPIQPVNVAEVGKLVQSSKRAFEQTRGLIRKNKMVADKGANICKVMLGAGQCICVDLVVLRQPSCVFMQRTLCSSGG
jgi:hypothetical protein